MPLTYFLAQIIGLYFLIIGALMLFRKRAFMEVISDFYRTPASLFLPGMIATFFGLMLVLNHDYWNAGTLAFIVTLIGWAVLIKGLALLFVPEAATRSVRSLKVRKLSWVYAAVVIIVGAYLACAGFIG